MNPMPSFADMSAPDMWRALAPALHVDDAGFMAARRKAVEFDPAVLDGIPKRLATVGYFQLPPPAWSFDLTVLGRGITAIAEAGYPPVFAFMYDETWAVFAQLAALLKTALGGSYMMMPAFWSWHVDGTREAAGWPPHRDNHEKALMPDHRTPRLVSLWIPLAEATPLNGCMYLLPADRDPFYEAPRDAKAGVDLQDIRALPAATGSVLGWTQAVYHWGGRARQPVTAPRISLSVEFQRADEMPVLEPLLDPETIPGVPDRARLILRQLLQYRSFSPLTPELAAFAKAHAQSGGA